MERIFRGDAACFLKIVHPKYVEAVAGVLAVCCEEGAGDGQYAPVHQSSHVLQVVTEVMVELLHIRASQVAVHNELNVVLFSNVVRKFDGFRCSINAQDSPHF